MYDTYLDYEITSGMLYRLTEGKLYFDNDHYNNHYDKEIWDNLELSSRPNTNMIKPPWEVVMRTAQEWYLGSTDRNISRLHDETERFISTIYGIPEGYEDFRLRKEIHDRKAQKEITQRDIITALRTLSLESGINIVLPTHLFECEDSAREDIKSQYHKRKQIILNTDSAYELNKAINEEYSIASAIGCFELTGQINVQVYQDNLQVGQDLSSDTQLFPVSELIGGRTLSIQSIQGEFISTDVPAVVLINNTNRTLFINNVNTPQQPLETGSRTEFFKNDLPLTLTAE